MNGDARTSAGVLSRAARLRLAYLWGYRTEDVDAYGFTGGRPLTDAGRFLGYDWYLSVVRPVLNDGGAKVLTENKWVFYRFADSLGLRCRGLWACSTPSTASPGTGSGRCGPSRTSWQSCVASSRAPS